MWDEKFHVTSAQKYLNDVFFMQAHPPLGKMLIALGEKIVDANDPELDSLYTNVTYHKNADKGISMRGYRLIPMLLAWALAPLSFLLFLLLIKDKLTAAVLSFFVIFDTALALVLKGALLESPLIFAVSLSSIAFVVLTKPKCKFILWSLILGISVGAAFVTKLTGLFLILFAPLLLIAFKFNWNKWLKFFGFFSVGFLVVSVGVWQLHFAMGKNIETELPNKGYYAASETYKKIIDKGGTSPIKLFPIALKDSMKYMFSHHTGVGQLDLCKDKQRGSPWFLMPLGVRSTHFITGHTKNDLGRYMYMQANPAVWWTSTIGVILGLIILAGSVLMGIKLKQRFLILSFVTLYFAYMIALSQIDRVMFLHHYLPALFISFVILALVINELFSKGIIKGALMQYIVMLIGALIVLCNIFYQPLLTMEPLSKPQLERRAFFSLWDLHCVDCEILNPMYRVRRCK